MREGDYAYGVARIRANENSLLTESDMRQLIAADSVASVLSLLEQKGWDTSHGVSDMLEARSAGAWTLLTECAPDIAVLDALVIQNDFHNLKAVLKALFSGDEPSDYYITPSVLPPSKIYDAVKESDYSLLPDYMSRAAETAYDAVSRLSSGFIADTVIDKASLEARYTLARRGGSELMIKLARLACASADVKIASRAAKLGRGRDDILGMMCVTDMFDNASLVDAALKGDGELCAFLASTELSDGALELKEGGFVAFERWCDDAAVSFVAAGKYTPLGPDPLIAYYIACDTEVKNARIIIAGKQNGLAPDEIGRRVRKAYV